MVRQKRTATAAGGAESSSKVVKLRADFKGDKGRGNVRFWVI